MKTPFCLMLIPPLIAGCAAQGEYPSLAKRPFEKTQSSPPPPVESGFPSDPASLARIADAVKQAREGVSGFEAVLPAASDAARRAVGSAEGSEAWISGQLAVSRLERALGSARNALSTLDDERRFLAQRPGSPDQPELDAAIAEVEAIDARQSASIKELLALLS